MAQIKRSGSGSCSHRIRLTESCLVRSVRAGLTAVEVLASTILASLLMVAMLGILQGLTKQSEALDIRLPIPSWQRTLDGVLQYDLENSQHYQLTKNSIIFSGFAGHDPETRIATWKPVKVVYEIVYDGHHYWLTRRELNADGVNLDDTMRDFVLADIRQIRAFNSAVGTNRHGTPPEAQADELSVTDGLKIEFWGESKGGPSYGFLFRQP